MIEQRLASGYDFERPVIVAVIAVRVMQVAIDEIVHVIAVRYGFVSAARAVYVGCVVAAALVVRCACVGIARRHVDHVFVDMVAMRMVQVPIVQVVDVIAVPYTGVPAVRAVGMGMGLVRVMFAMRHRGLLVWRRLSGNLVRGVTLRRILGGVLEHSVHQLQYVIVGQAVIHVLALASPADQVCAQQ